MVKVSNYWTKQSQKKYEIASREVEREEFKKKQNENHWSRSAEPIMRRYAPSRNGRKPSMNEWSIVESDDWD